MLGLTTILKFLLFNRQAIRQIAHSPVAVWPGLFFVFSAAFAREYDGEYLVAEPWHLLIPVTASLVACGCMSLLLWILTRSKGIRIGYLSVFRPFLNLYWMTAPLAWLYAIPFERMMTPGDATTANLTLLGIVAAWRVALMVRSVQVLFDCRLFTAIIPVMFFSVLLVMAALWLVPGPIFMIMGGIRLSESEDVILGFRLMLGLAAWGSVLFWLIFYVILCTRKELGWSWTLDSNRSNQTETNDATPASRRSLSVPLWLVAIAANLTWYPILKRTQPEQALRYQAKQLILEQNFARLCNLTQAYPESEFPPHWDPPPRPAYGESEPPVIDVLIGLMKHNGAQWMIAHYDRKLNDQFHTMWFDNQLLEYSDDQLSFLLDYAQDLDTDHVLLNIFANLEQQIPNVEGLPEQREQLFRDLIALGKSRTQ